MRSNWVAIVLLLFSIGATASESSPARSFIDDMVRGIGARKVRCSDEVASGTQLRELRAVCARFDGDFESFAARWDRHLGRESSAGWRSDDAQATAPRPQSAWQDREGTHEIIYAVGSTVVGVRFERGDVLLVYK